MGIIRREQSELRFNSLWLLEKQNNPDYHIQLFKNAKAFFLGMKRPDLLEDLNFIIKERIEKIMGTPISQILITYKNLPYLNSFTRSKNPLYTGQNIYKYTLQEWLDDIETWIFQKAMELEGEIRFTTVARQFI